MKKFFTSFFVFLTIAATAVSQTGQVTGRVTDGTNPLLGFVFLYQTGDTKNIFQQTYFNIGSNGVYTFAGIPDGNYFIRVNSAASQNGQLFIDEVYNDRVCSAGKCEYDSATPITISGGNTVTGVDFSLITGSQINGQILNRGKQLSGKVYVQLHDSAGAVLTKQPTTDTGGYAINGVAPGTYFVSVSTTLGVVDELYDNIPCPNTGCTITAGTPVAVPAPQSFVTANFDLQPGGRISGVVRAELNKRVIPRVPVAIYNTQGQLAASAITDRFGEYTTDSVLPTGSYYVRTNTTAFQNKIYRDRNCTSISCEVTSGRPVAVTAGRTTRGVSFSLDNASSGKAVDLIGKWTKPSKRFPNSYTLTITNRGRSNAGGFDVRVLIVNSAAGSEKVYRSYHFSNLPQKASRNFNITFTKNQKGKVAIAEIDEEGLIGETNRNNNRPKVSIN